jgi:curved DNA-binding protein CbpA
MAEPLPDLYADLDVAPGADASEIKLAYFTLVRRFPPETHPERFQRIRVAYEVLSDPGRREAYDQERQRPPEPADPEAAALWSSAQAANEARDFEAELRALRRLVEVRPVLTRAREVLAERLLELGPATEAVTLLRGLLAERPDQARLLLQLSRGLRDSNQAAEAMAAATRAAEVGPDEADFRVAVADAFSALKRYNEARAELERALRLLSPQRPIPPIERRRAAYLFEEGRRVDGVEAIERAIDAWAGAEPGERREAVAFLSGFAAYLFSHDQWTLAGRVLARARIVAPDAAPGALPQQVLLHERELPPEVRDWIRERRERPRWLSRYDQGSHWNWLVAGVVATLFVALALWLSFSITSTFTAEGWAWVAVLTALPALVGLLALDRWRRFRNDPLGHGLILHSLHVLEVRHDRVRVTPLFALTGGKVRPSANTAGHFEAAFKRVGGGQLKLKLRSQAEASEVANRIWSQRQRAFELLAEGALPQEAHWDLFPPELLARPGWSRRVGVLRPRTLAATVAALLLACSGLGLLADRVAAERAELEAFAATARTGTVMAWQFFLRSWPGGAHARGAQLRIAQLVVDARAALEEKGASPALLAAFDAHSAKGRVMPVVVETSFLGPVALDPGLLRPLVLEQAGRMAERSERLTRRLSGIVSAAAGRSNVAWLGLVAPDWSRFPVLRVRLAVVLAGEELSPDGRSPRRALALDGRWTLEVRASASAAFEPFGAGAVRGPARLEVPAAQWAGPAPGVADQIYLAQLDTLLDEAAEAAAAALGVRKEPVR